MTNDCDNCDGYGFTIRPVGPHIIQLNDLIMQHPRGGPCMTLKQAQSYIKKFPSEIPGFTDRNTYQQCMKCGGNKSQ